MAFDRIESAVVISGAFNPEQLETVIILMFACLGFVAGVGTWGGVSGGTRWMTVMSARLGREAPKSTIEWVPRGMFTSLLLVTIPIVKGWCPRFLREHTLVLLLMVVCGISAGVWLLTAFLIQDAIDAARKRRIEEFIASAPGAEPAASFAPPEPFPLWLKAWKWANVLTFSLIVMDLVGGLVA